MAEGVKALRFGGRVGCLAEGLKDKSHAEEGSGAGFSIW